MTTGSAIRHFTLDLDDLEWTGNDLVRPESVVAEPDGTLWASDARGGATRIDPGGGQSFLGGWGGEPNGLAIDPSGDLVTANIALGLVQRMTREDQWWPAVAHPRPDGFIVLVDDSGARIVADGIYGTNEARLDPDERYLDQKSTRLHSSHITISYAVFCLKKKKRRARSLRLPRRSRSRSPCAVRPSLR